MSRMRVSTARYTGMDICRIYPASIPHSISIKLQKLEKNRDSNRGSDERVGCDKHRVSKSLITPTTHHCCSI